MTPVSTSVDRSYETELLSRSLADFQNPPGRNLSTRYSDFADWVRRSSERGLFQFLRWHEEAPDTRSSVRDHCGKKHSGLNLASQDYLGLARHPSVVAGAVDALTRFGAHSSGSEPMGGGLGSAKALERQVAALTGHRRVVLFPTGWAAGYGAIKGLVRPDDVVVMDVLAHDCLQHGARASTANLHHFAHNDVVSCAKRVRNARRAHPDSAILVVTESLFSMDSDHPDFSALVALCREHEAHLMVDCAHDLGLLGEGGRGVLHEAGVLGEVDFLVSSFSKTFASIGGFFATHDTGTESAVRGFSGSYTFSNFMVPSQVAAISAAIRIVASPEGDALRAETLRNARTLRDALDANGIETCGRTSAIVIARIGPERIARTAYRHCLEQGLILNCIEYPACRRGEARFRLQVTPSHEADDLRRAARVVAESLAWAWAVYGSGRTEGRADRQG
jgi:7-keto-8-aminopelargonate synthetase-like enzyme